MDRALRIRRFVWIFGAMLLGALALGAMQAAKTLKINGSTASSRVIEVKGMAYVPVQDVAKALQMAVAKTSKGYELKPAGGAGMVQGLLGKVGDELFNGFVRFKVVEVLRGKSYINRFSGDKQAITPFPEENDLVVVVIRIRNGLKVALDLGLPGGQLSGLTDMNARTYAFRNGVTTDVPDRLAHLLPGSAVDFALTFDVAPDVQLKDLVYEAQDLGGKHKAKPFRISLR